MRTLLFIIIAMASLCLPQHVTADSTTDDTNQSVVATTNVQNTSWEDIQSAADQNVSDPLEPWNRVVFTINDLFYHAILNPISLAYEFFLPKVVRVAVSNFFNNLSMPKHFISALLQGKIATAGRELGRFGINTTLGGLGFFDVADTHFNLKSGDEDIGQTLGTYGMGDALYIEWPILGPSNLRDTIGLAGDTLLNPLSYYPRNEWTRMAIYGGKIANQTSLHLGEYEDLKESAIDPYIAVRDAYLQMRRDRIKH